MKKLYAYSFRITIVYFLLGIIWISTSDYILELFSANMATLSRFQSYKGWFYVSVTSGLLYILTSKYEKLLKQNIQQLKKANNDLRIFLYKASHDLKGPIASILGLTNLFKIENPRLKDSAIIEKIEASSFRSDFIIKDLLKLANLLEKNQEPSAIDLENLFDLVIEDFKRNNRIKENIEVVKSIQVDRFFSDKYLIQLVIEKTLENAIIYQNPNIIQKRIEFAAHSNGTHIEMEIQDNGLGIDGQQIGRVFDMFFRGSEHSNGSGLGLYFAKLAIEKLKGQIKVFSIPKVGTKLTIIIPRLTNKKAG